LKRKYVQIILFFYLFSGFLGLPNFVTKMWKCNEKNKKAQLVVADRCAGLMYVGEAISDTQPHYAPHFHTPSPHINGNPINSCDFS
jgi:hypothetical protein